MVDDSELGPTDKAGLEEASTADDSRAKVRLTLIFPNICEGSHYYREQLVYGMVET